jgi:hypothetical protein
MISHRCQTCLWYDREHISLKELDDKNLGYCRKHKPIVYGKEGRHYGSWPLVDINDLCGEWREDKQ